MSKKHHSDLFEEIAMNEREFEALGLGIDLEKPNQGIVGPDKPSAEMALAEIEPIAREEYRLTAGSLPHRSWPRCESESLVALPFVPAYWTVMTCFCIDGSLEVTS